MLCLWQSCCCRDVRATVEINKDRQLLRYAIQDHHDYEGRETGGFIAKQSIPRAFLMLDRVKFTGQERSLCRALLSWNCDAVLACPAAQEVHHERFNGWKALLWKEERWVAAGKTPIASPCLSFACSVSRTWCNPDFALTVNGTSSV